MLHVVTLIKLYRRLTSAVRARRFELFVHVRFASRCCEALPHNRPWFYRCILDDISSILLSQGLTCRSTLLLTLSSSRSQQNVSRCVYLFFSLSPVVDLYTNS